VVAQSVPLRIYVEGTSSKDNKRGGAGIFFGPNSPQNKSVKVPGPGRLTADRARLFATHEAIRAAPDDKSLLIFCTSKMIIRQICYLAAKNNQLGWPGNNGDIFKSIVKLLAMRKATSCFIHIDSKANNDAKRGAYSQAKSALNLPGPCEAFIPITNIVSQHVDIQIPDALVNTRKVYSDLEEKSPVKPKLWKTGEDTPTLDKDTDRSHRGRAKVHALQFGLRKELLSCKEPKEFWDWVRKRTDPRPKLAKVSVQALSDEFETRLNYPAVMPASFNAEQLAFNARMNKQLKGALSDTSPRQSYTRDITMEEIEAMKRHIKAHGIDTAMGSHTKTAWIFRTKNCSLSSCTA
jgi:ribonuclease HI